MDYTVERIPERVRIDPNGGQGERQPKREKPARKGGRDSVSISDEARRRSRPDQDGEEHP